MDKKIILIDDNSKNQREEYNASFVDNELYSDCLNHFERLNSDSDFSFINNAACVMLHDSLEDYINGKFQADSHKAKEIIEDWYLKNNIPYVLFSDGHSDVADWREDKPNIVYSIKKSKFYHNLRDFLNHYKETSTLDLRIIAYGKDFIKQMMSEWGQSIISGLNNLNDNDILSTSLIDRHALRKFIENAHPKIGLNFKDLMCDIEDEKVTVGQFITNISNIISCVKKYGKNICIWK